MASYADLKENYAKAYGKSKLSFGPNVALIVIDCVRAYLTPSSPLYSPPSSSNFSSAHESILRLIENCRRADNSIPIIYTSTRYETPLAGGKWRLEKLPEVLCCYDVGNELGRFAEGVEPRVGKDGKEVVVSKQYASAFFGTSLASVLVSLKIDTVICCGFSTSGCVRATALDAMQYGFSPFVVKDACGDRHQVVHEANLFDMEAKFAEVVGEEEIIKLVEALKN